MTAKQQQKTHEIFLKQFNNCVELHEPESNSVEITINAGVKKEHEFVFGNLTLVDVNSVPTAKTKK
jgi:hypothetical protein